MTLPIAYGYGKFIRDRRDAAGLTREELAVAANMSINTLKAIEQGARNVTLQNLEALATALYLPQQLRMHLAELALPGLFAADVPPEFQGKAPLAVFPLDRVDIESSGHAISLDVHPLFEIVAVNAAMERLYPGLEETGNGLIWMFTNPRAQEIVIDWEAAAFQMLAIFRHLTSGVVDPLRLQLIINECSPHPQWEELWNGDRYQEVLPNDIVRLRVDGEEQRFFRRIDSPWYPARRYQRNRLVPLPETLPTPPPARPKPARLRPFFTDGLTDG